MLLLILNFFIHVKVAWLTLIVAPITSVDIWPGLSLAMRHSVVVGEPDIFFTA